MDTGNSVVVLKMLDHHTVFIFLIQVTILLAVARLLGELMQKMGQPAVIGELAAGVILGPSFLGALAPSIHSKVFPKIQLQADLLSVVSWIGVIFLLVVIGLETDLKLIKRKGKKAMMVSIIGICIPLTSGLLLGWLLPDSYLINKDQRLIFSLFMAVAMSISAVAVIAKVLLDMKLIRRDIGQVTLAAGMTDDLIGWILLSVVAGMVTKGSISFFDIFITVLFAIGFITIGLTIGPKIISRILSFVDSYFGGTTAQFSTILVLAFASAAFTHKMGIEAVLGAFIIGVLAGQSNRFKKEVAHTLEITTSGFVAPVFFAAAGLRVDLLRLAQPDVFFIAMLILLIACAGKFLGAFIGAKAVGFSFWERIAIGAGMNARGAMEIIVATVGLGLGILTIEIYSIIVMVAIVTSFMAPFILRWTLSKVTIGEEEAQRLEKERFSETSFLYSIKRVVLVGTSRLSTRLAAKVLGKLAKSNNIDFCILLPQTIDDATAQKIPFEVDESTPAILQKLIGEDFVIETKIKTGAAISDVILAEAGQSNKELVVMGSRPKAQKKKQRLFGDNIDPVLLQAKSPCLIFDEACGLVTTEKILQSERIQKILVPTTGSAYSARALELAAGIAASHNATIDLLHILNKQTVDRYLLSHQAEDTAMQIAEDMIRLQVELGKKIGATVVPHIMNANSPEEEILRFSFYNKTELIVMGSNLRSSSERAFFGYRIEHVLNHASCPVLVLVS